MTQTPLAPRTHDTPPPVRTGGRARVLLRFLAIVSCLPYLSLKIAWIAGSQVGIPDGSPLLDNPTTMAVANGGTVLMDGSVIVLALLLTQAWGLRVRAWLLVLPMWTASGLLLPIMGGFPLQLLVGALDGSGPGADTPSFLEGWVFALVYPGFIVQGLALGALFALYARDRWGHLWQGALRDLPPSPTAPALRVAAVAASLLAVVPATMHLLWASGSTVGLNGSRIAGRTDDFYALQALDALFVAATVAGVLLLAFRRTGGLSLKVPLALAWAGSGAVGCSGGWLSIASLAGVEEMADRATPGMELTYAVQMLVGLLVVTLGAYFFAERAAAAKTAGSRA
ncbi:hypothetical protein OG596_29100 [Streptomyces sp. NBC_01102]|uniref:hypothetical protein n=1 Tax=Streptomyces sp. NBC_01102 TaxID=2903749 RepID=UPI003868A4C7|nr:hypothetical protein OG596_29100 [Streptomyces sp. NBC_01102]